MVSQQLQNELKEILEQMCSKKFEKSEVVKIAIDLVGFFDLLNASFKANERNCEKNRDM